MTPIGRTPVTLVCVFNDAAVREHCLDRSVAALRETAPETEYLPIDNTEHAFASAGAALNSGARRATNPVVVLVHQDVYLHSLVALEEAAHRLLHEPDLGVLGAIGVDSSGTLQGRIRDRVVLLGREVDSPTDVDSLDEVLFLATRQRLLARPLSEEADLAWHAYAVEYGLAARREGLRVAAVPVPLTHNSLTINLARLDDAHAFLAATYPEQTPVRTTCGTVGGGTRTSWWRRAAGSQRWRRSWWQESRVVREVCRGLDLDRVVLADVRRELDTELDRVQPECVVVLNCTQRGESAFPEPADGTRLRRRSHAVVHRAVPATELLPTWHALRGRHPVLTTGLGPTELAELGPALRTGSHLVGYHEGIGFWALSGPIAEVEGARWTRGPLRPFGYSAVARG